jgi:hypothetical protein
MNAQQFSERLRSIVPSKDGTHIEALHELTGLAQDLLRDSATAPTVFAYFETHNTADLGSPGPLIHYLERSFPEYVEALISSIIRRPVSYTLWMANRILNAHIEESMRAQLLQALECSRKHPLATEDERLQAIEFIKLHT